MRARGNEEEKWGERYEEKWKETEKGTEISWERQRGREIEIETESGWNERHRMIAIDRKRETNRKKVLQKHCCRYIDRNWKGNDRKKNEGE